VPTSLSSAFLDLAQEAEPKQTVQSVKTPTAPLKSPDDVRLYIAELSKTLDRAVADGPVVVS
jgi:hypothetical protein